MTSQNIGTCDDCGAENVPIWLTEYNWQCAKCMFDEDDLRAALASVTAERDALREACEEALGVFVAEWGEGSLTTQILRAALERSAPE